MSPFFFLPCRQKEGSAACLSSFHKAAQPSFLAGTAKKGLRGRKGGVRLRSIAKEKQMTVLLKAFPHLLCHNPLELAPAVPQGVGAVCTCVCLFETGGKRVSISVGYSVGHPGEGAVVRTEFCRDKVTQRTRACIADRSVPLSPPAGKTSHPLSLSSHAQFVGPAVLKCRCGAV